MEVFLMRGWDIILTGRGGTSALARGATLAAAGSKSPRQSPITQRGWGFHTLRGAVPNRGICFFVPGLSELQR